MNYYIVTPDYPGQAVGTFADSVQAYKYARENFSVYAIRDSQYITYGGFEIVELVSESSDTHVGASRASLHRVVQSEEISEQQTDLPENNSVIVAAKRLPKRPLPIEQINQRVKVYGYTTATHKQPLWFSVMQCNSVKGHAISVILQNVVFEINTSGETRCREGVKKRDGSWLKKPNTKTPYAFACGDLQFASLDVQSLGSGIPVRFYPNNRKNGYFGNAITGQKINTAERVLLTIEGVMAFGVN